MRYARTLVWSLLLLAAGFWLRGQLDAPVTWSAEPAARPAPLTTNAPAPVLPALQASPPPASMDRSALEAELRVVRRQLEDTQAQLAVAQGEALLHRRELEASLLDAGRPRIAAPANLPPRFSSDAFRSALVAALAEVAGKGAELTEMDCTEYPCIAYGRGVGGKEGFDRLGEAAALREYRDDSRNAFGFNLDGRQYFGLALMPSDAALNTPELEARIRERMQEMQATYSQPTKPR